MTDNNRRRGHQGNRHDQDYDNQRQREKEEHRRYQGQESRYGQPGYGSGNDGGNYYGSTGGYGQSSDMNWGSSGRGSGSDRGSWGGSNEGNWENERKSNQGWGGDQGSWNRDQDRGNWQGSSGQAYGSQGGWGSGSERYSGRGSDMYGSQSGWGTRSSGFGSGFSGWGGGAGSMGGYGSGGEFGYGSRQQTGYGSPGGTNQNEDRGFWNRTKDEVSSWFGDDDAERRRELDRRMSEMEQRQSINYGYGAIGDSYGSSMSRFTHRGKGPKDYRRSDDRIREDVSDRLADDERVDASEIEVLVNNSEVTLAGVVDSREAKRRAEDLAEQVSGVQNVQNNIRVNREGAASNRSETSGSTSPLFGFASGSGSGATGRTELTGTPGAGDSGTGSNAGQSSGRSSGGTSGKEK